MSSENLEQWRGSLLCPWERGEGLPTFTSEKLPSPAFAKWCSIPEPWSSNRLFQINHHTQCSPLKHLSYLAVTQWVWLFHRFVSCLFYYLQHRTKGIAHNQCLQEGRKGGEKERGRNKQPIKEVVQLSLWGHNIK